MCLSKAMVPGRAGNMTPMGSAREQGEAKWDVAAAQGALRPIWAVSVPVPEGHWDLESGSLCQQRGMSLAAAVVG